MKTLQSIIYIILFISVSACNYLDIVPDNVATIDNAFRMRSTAERFLFTCYSYMPSHSARFTTGNPAMTAGDEVWFMSNALEQFDMPGWEIALGNQNVVNPFFNYWDGGRGGHSLFTGIRDCNIFMEKIGDVRDLDDYERRKWVAEAKVLKAYYHFWLLRMYGPIPLIRENLPISAGVTEVAVNREPIDQCIDYIVSLLDESAQDLPDIIQLENEELGRITKPIALSLKAKVLVTAASPLFNGNPEYSSFISRDGTRLFNSEYDVNKWQRAADACREAIELCHQVGISLYHYVPTIYQLSDTTVTELSIRNSISQRWNSEIIWANTSSRMVDMQRESQALFFPDQSHNSAIHSRYAPTLKMAELYYTDKGVPIAEDKTWDYDGRYDIKTASADDKLYIKEGYQTVALHFGREPRFYAGLGFDGGRWYGQGRYEDVGNFYVEAKSGQLGLGTSLRRSATGYFCKKLVNYQSTASPNGFTIEPYPWPILRLSDLYLLYAETLNELNGPGQAVMGWVDQIRARAGLPAIETAWTMYSSRPDKYQTKEGFREIIQQERMIELAFEGQRYWDLKRWKKAPQVLNGPVQGWNNAGETADDYYRVVTFYNQSFRPRDYFWPIREMSILVNKNLVQNPGW